MSSGYLRYPHIHGDLLTFVAGDAVWLAPAAGGRAWRLSADDAPVSYPRSSRDGTRVAWSSGRDGNPEDRRAVPVAGRGPDRRAVAVAVRPASTCPTRWSPGEEAPPGP